ncbi:hypothetical protein L2E82_36465 [Cichorium intybus]|uniref:Uncharacterized protein n=1 Tax=Cichorium intybus TaxID=13427 RepID=A0ACB9BRT2_CICIN|nr:hypothetical protein L2E82_36465 [Cichorium intybus]
MRLGKGIGNGLINRAGFWAHGKGEVDGGCFSARVGGGVAIVARTRDDRGRIALSLCWGLWLPYLIPFTSQGQDESIALPPREEMAPIDSIEGIKQTEREERISFILSLSQRPPSYWKAPITLAKKALPQSFQAKGSVPGLRLGQEGYGEKPPTCQDQNSKGKRQYSTMSWGLSLS